MENIEIMRENEEEGLTIYNHREYNIKNEKNAHILRLEINDKYINIIITLDINIEYNYKTKMSLNTIVNKLELNIVKYSNLEIILKLFDKLYESKKLFININHNDESCSLLIKLSNPLEEITNYEIKLYKQYMKVDDKFNLLFNQFKLFKSKNSDNAKIIEMNNKINELNIKFEQKDKVINEMSKKIKNQENRINDLENKNNNIINENKKLNELFNKNENVIKKLKESISNLENNFKSINNNNLNQINEIIANIKKIREEINKLNKESKNINNDQDYNFVTIKKNYANNNLFEKPMRSYGHGFLQTVEPVQGDGEDPNRITLIIKYEDKEFYHETNKNKRIRDIIKEINKKYGIPKDSSLYFEEENELILLEYYNKIVQYPKIKDNSKIVAVKN